MARKLMSQLTPEQQQAQREYFAEKKRESRERKVEEGKCPTCGVRDAKPDGITCFDCDEIALERDRAKGFPARPSTLIRRAGQRIIREGGRLTLGQVADETGFEKAFVREVLIRHGMWTPGERQ